MVPGLHPQQQEQHDQFPRVSLVLVEQRYLQGHYLIPEEHNLPGFDHDLFANHRYHNVKPMAQILREYVTTRAASIELFSGFLDEEMKKAGMANGLKIDVETLAFLITDHETHHMSVLSEKYLQAFA